MHSLRAKHHQLKRNGLESVQMARIIGRKRVVVPVLAEESGFASPTATPMQKRRQRRSQADGLNLMDALPHDILVRTLCKVNHSDLRQLLLVSKSVHEATLVAKDMHFAFSTPSKPVRNGSGGAGYDEGSETPDAPKQHRVAKSRIDGKKLAGIAVALFASHSDY
ncbi:hypothetical protein J5N97_011950 [Dioscorea zingiberensis]|uniref:F-box domain-containing protein n=1 Tax=Dioscorea zingiberensis TaxID=325984 RepID=A0A9D5D420_9LILI|nr:hypothetical protein J5N97_011950 [Dioscorea zingiberensis]